MKMGLFDKQKSKNQAKQFLTRSMHTLGSLLKIDTSLVDENSPNPYQPDSALHYGFEILKSEIGIYNKL